MSDMDEQHEEGGMGRRLRVRPYALTGGRTRSGADLPFETLVKVSQLGQSAAPRLALERKKIAQMCSSPISIAEISAHLHVPIGVARVLVGDMNEEGLLTTYKPDTSAGERPTIQLLERVLDGLQAL
jgi:hypothetical protein